MVKGPGVVFSNCLQYNTIIFYILVVSSYLLNVLRPPHDYTSTQHLFSLKSLTDRRHSANLSFLSNHLPSKIDCPELLSRIFFNILYHCTRSSVPFHILFSSSNYYLNSIIRLMRIANNNQTHPTQDRKSVV